MADDLKAVYDASRFKRDAPTNVRPIEDAASATGARKEAKRKEKAARRPAEGAASAEPSLPDAEEAA